MGVPDKLTDDMEYYLKQQASEAPLSDTRDYIHILPPHPRAVARFSRRNG